MRRSTGKWNGTTTMLAIGLIGFGMVGRWMFSDIPNFKPFMAVALMAGFLFGFRWRTAMIALAGLVITDAAIGFYDGVVMVAVYGSVLIGCGTGAWLQRTGGLALPIRAMSVMGGSLAMSLLFFLVTNGAVVVAGWYPATWEGLGQSYLAGLPFLRYTMLGDLAFTCLLFGGCFAFYGLRLDRTIGERTGNSATDGENPIGWVLPRLELRTARTR